MKTTEDNTREIAATAEATHARITALLERVTEWADGNAEACREGRGSWGLAGDLCRIEQALADLCGDNG